MLMASHCLTHNDLWPSLNCETLKGWALGICDTWSGARFQNVFEKKCVSELVWKQKVDFQTVIENYTIEAWVPGPGPGLLGHILKDNLQAKCCVKTYRKGPLVSKIFENGSQAGFQKGQGSNCSTPTFFAKDAKHYEKTLELRSASLTLCHAIHKNSLPIRSHPAGQPDNYYILEWWKIHALD